MQKTFAELSKDSKKDCASLPRHKFAILGDCATQHLAMAIKGYAYPEGLGFEVYDADYNQIDAQVLDENSELYAFKPDTILIYMCVEKLYLSFTNTPIEERSRFAENTAARIEAYWQNISRNTAAHILQFNFADLDDAVFGNYALKTPISFPYQLKKLNFLLMEKVANLSAVELLDLANIQNAVGREKFFDDKLYYIATAPISLDSLPAVAKIIIDAVKAKKGLFKKCAILDLDNTLWGGVIGDDGIEGIQIGELGIGKAFTDLQIWLKELSRRGIILAVCSKNNEETAKEPFLKHPEMTLKLDDIAMFVANWEDKAGNIRRIQETLNIGMDSIVFIDDNPFERELVSSLIPEITVPDLPEDPALYLSCLRRLNLFETASYSDADIERTAQYRAEADRTALAQNAMSFDEYLQSLDMVATVAPFDSFHYPRIAQLTQRSNQFNLRTVRYTDAEIETIANDKNCITRYFCLHDKFGDYGLVSLVILNKCEEDKSLFISEWLMSCRVLKRGMEEFIINTIMDIARENGYAKVFGEYIPTPKNAMVRDIYEKLGFKNPSNGKFEATPQDFSYNKTYIKGETK